MLALVVHEPGSFEVTEVNDPTPEPGEVLIEVAACGICGTDLHIIDGDYHGSYPIIPGHELSATVLDEGDSAHLAPGDRVAINPNIYCHACRMCRRGMPHLRECATAVGVTRAGGFAELCAVPATAPAAAGGGRHRRAMSRCRAACTGWRCWGRVRRSHRDLGAAPWA